MKYPKESLGNLTIKDQAIAELAIIAARKVPHVKEIKGNLLEQFLSLISSKLLPNGVKVTIQEKEVIIDLSIVVEYGADIAAVGAEVQEKVTDAVEKMAGFTVAEVNISVMGVA